jgi:hypothetical protein
MLTRPSWPRPVLKTFKLIFCFAIINFEKGGGLLYKKILHLGNKFLDELEEFSSNRFLDLNPMRMALRGF